MTPFTFFLIMFLSGFFFDLSLKKGEIDELKKELEETKKALKKAKAQ